VVPVNGGCIAGPGGSTLQSWDVERGKTYRLTLSNVIECGLAGTAATINVRVENSVAGHVDLVATLVAVGTYICDYTVPLNAACSGPIACCTVAGQVGSGIFLTRSDGGSAQAQLRVATFAAACLNPTVVTAPGCGLVPTEKRTWGAVKSIYR
jgi:hypothetical protein